MGRIKRLWANENNRIILRNMLGAFVVRGGALVLSLYTMPAYMRYFGDQQVLGLWFTMLSVLSWVLTFDLGIGNGLRNHLVRTLAAHEYAEAKRYISSAYVCVGLVVAAVLVVAYVVFPWIDWNGLFGVGADAIAPGQLRQAVWIVFAGLMLQFFLRLITSILYAMQRSALNNLLTLISSALILGYVLTAQPADPATDLIRLSVANVVAMNLPLLAATVVVFITTLKDCRPRLRCTRRRYMQAVLKLGGMFFWTQVVYMLIHNTNEFLITGLTAAEHVVEYQVYHKLFTLIGTVFTLALTPVWSAVTKAVAQREYSWVQRLYRILCLLAGLASVGELLLVPLTQVAVNLWLGDQAIPVHYGYAAASAVLGCLMVWNGVLSSLANGLGKPQAQAIFLTVGVIVKFPVAWLLVRLTGSWIGVVWASVVAMIPFCVVQPLWLGRYIQKLKHQE